MKQQLIPEDARDRIRACIGSEDTMKFKTCAEVSDLWAELKHGIIAKKMEMEGWQAKEAEGKSHRWFLASIAADAGLGYQSMLNRQRVGDAVIARGYYGGENESVSYQKWVSLMVNAEKGEDGLIKTSVLEERLEWFHQVADDNYGQPPSVLDIQNQFRSNGEITEWLLIWKKIIRNAKKLLKVEDTPKKLQKIIQSLLLNADADFTGGKIQKQKAVSSAGTRKYEVPTIIYKGEGFTGAMKNER